MPQKPALTFSPEKWCILIPARLGSSRLPNKPILPYKGKPLVVQTANIGLKIKDQHSKITVAVATDSEQIREVCHENKIETIMTKGVYISGSDRVHAAATKTNKPYILNLQCDEPEIPAEELILLMSQLESSKTLDMSTVAGINSCKSSYHDPNIVKCLATDSKSEAIDFSRQGFATKEQIERDDFHFLHHKGIYAYSKSSLDKFCSLPPSKRELSERLEQLRAIESNMSIGLIISSEVSKGVDAPGDLK